MAVGISALAVLALSTAWDPDALFGGIGDPKDGGWADVGFVISPFIAIASAFAVGLVLVVVAGLRLVDLSVGGAVKASLIGVVGGPVLYVVALVVSASALDSLSSVRVLAFFVFVWPAICGVGVTLVAALFLRQRAQARSEGPDSAGSQP